MKPYGAALIIDDAIFMREVIKDAIDEIFDRVDEAANAIEALERIANRGYDLITVDITLDPVEPAQGVRLIGDIGNARKSAVIIVISALDQKWLTRETLAKGAVAFIVKPFEKDDLRRTVLSLLEKRGEAYVGGYQNVGTKHGC